MAEEELSRQFLLVRCRCCCILHWFRCNLWVLYILFSMECE